MEKYFRLSGEKFTVKNDNEKKIILDHINDNILNNTEMKAKSLILSGEKVTGVLVKSKAKGSTVLSVEGYYPAMRLLKDNNVVGNAYAKFETISIKIEKKEPETTSVKPTEKIEEQVIHTVVEEKPSIDVDLKHEEEITEEKPEEFIAENETNESETSEGIITRRTRNRRK